jgi:RNA polymerase sigma factor (sigma-70 family)
MRCTRREIDESDLELVRRVARRVWRRCGSKPDLDDLESDGLEQVARQMGTWRPEGGLSWRRFIAERARYGMIEGIRKRTRPGRIPPDGSAVLSLDCPLDDGRSGAQAALGELIADPRTDVERHVELRLAVAEVLELPEREREVLIRHAAGETLRSIGEGLGVGGTRAGQIEQAAARRLAPSPPVEQPESPEGAALTPPELGALEGAALGLTAAETAAALSKSTETVKDQRRAVLRKLGARDMTNAVFLASKAGMLDHLEGTEDAA